MRKYLKLSMIMFMGMILIACATSGTICQDIPEGQNSVICMLADKMGTSPEAMSQILQVANFVALEKSLYRAVEAQEFVDEIIRDLKGIKENTITYTEAVNYVNKKYNILSKEVQAVFIIINPADLATKEIKIPLSEYDINLLIGHLEKQKAIIEVYL